MCVWITRLYMYRHFGVELCFQSETATVFFFFSNQCFLDLSQDTLNFLQSCDDAMIFQFLLQLCVALNSCFLVISPLVTYQSTLVYACVYAVVEPLCCLLMPFTEWLKATVVYEYICYSGRCFSELLLLFHSLSFLQWIMSFGQKQTWRKKKTWTASVSCH